ncbi:MAG: VOC family protein [Microthrixaceae bacterium]
MTVRWLTVFIDRPEATVGVATDFWQRVTGTTRSPTRGDRGQFAALLPGEGNPHIRVQRVDHGRGGTHLDLHTDEIPRLVDDAIDLGATLLDDDPVHVLRSPGGHTWCIVDWHGEATPSAPVAGPSGAMSRLDQVCLDIASDHLDAEVRFWAGLLGWPATTSTVRPEFTSLARPDGMPMRLLFQRLDQSDGPTTGHLDLAAGEQVDDVVADHVAAGAEVEIEEVLWTVLRDPSGHRYCITRRDPLKGTIAATRTEPPVSGTSR